MFHSDLSYTQAEKATLFTLEGKAFLNSYVDALNFVK